MKYYSLLNIPPTTDKWIPAYLKEAGGIIIRYGEKYLARAAKHSEIERKENTSSLPILLEWPSKDAAHNFMKISGYVLYLDARTEDSSSEHYLIKTNAQFASK